MKKPSTGPKQRNAFRDNYLAAIIAVAALLLSLSSAAQTLDTSRVRQGVFANPGYDYIGLGTSRTLLLPRDTFPQAARDSGAISIKNGTIYRWTGNHYVPTGGTDNSIATGSRTATGDYTQNWNRHQLIFDTTKDVRIYSNAPDWNFTNNKHTFLFEHYNSVIGSPPLSLKWSLRNVTNTSDSVGGGIVSDLYSTTVSHSTGSQSGQLYLGDGTAQIAGYGAKASTITAYQGTITLDAADSIMARLKPAATADSIVGVVNYGFGLNKLVKIPNTGGGSGVTSVATSYGLTGGTITSTGTLKVDTTGSNGITTRSELKDTTSRLKKAISDSLIYALKSILIPSRLEFIASADTANYQDSALIGSQIMMLSIESYQVGFTTRSTSIYMSFDATTGTISLTNGQFAAGDQVIVIYRTPPVFLLDGSGSPVRDGSGNFIILN